LIALPRVVPRSLSVLSTATLLLASRKAETKTKEVALTTFG
jgi:hypothetical protein